MRSLRSGGSSPLWQQPCAGTSVWDDDGWLGEERDDTTSDTSRYLALDEVTNEVLALHVRTRHHGVVN